MRWCLQPTLPGPSRARSCSTAQVSSSGASGTRSSSDPAPSMASSVLRCSRFPRHAVASIQTLHLGTSGPRIHVGRLEVLNSSVTASPGILAIPHPCVCSGPRETCCVNIRAESPRCCSLLTQQGRQNALEVEVGIAVAGHLLVALGTHYFFNLLVDEVVKGINMLPHQTPDLRIVIKASSGLLLTCTWLTGLRYCTSTKRNL